MAVSNNLFSATTPECKFSGNDIYNALINALNSDAGKAAIKAAVQSGGGHIKAGGSLTKTSTGLSGEDTVYYTFNAPSDVKEYVIGLLFINSRRSNQTVGSYIFNVRTFTPKDGEIVYSDKSMYVGNATGFCFYY